MDNLVETFERLLELLGPLRDVDGIDSHTIDELEANVMMILDNLII